MIRLTRSDPSRSMHRFYAVQLAPTLFGERSMVAEWGRIGSPGEGVSNGGTGPDSSGKTHQGQNQARVPALGCFQIRFVRRPRMRSSQAARRRALDPGYEPRALAWVQSQCGPAKLIG